jgi:Mrp family chromosome partitioning ATPase
LSVVDPVRRLISRVGRKDELPARVSFVAALRQEGVSFVSQAFATVLAYDLETSVCIVDLNWWWPSALAMKIPASGGLGAVLTGETSLEQAVIQSGRPNLAILPAGELSINQRAHYARSAQLKDTILELAVRYDHLVLDIPAVLAANDAISLASLGAACCLVIRQGVTSIAEVKSTLNDLDHLPNLGVVLNRYHFATPDLILKFINPD